MQLETFPALALPGLLHAFTTRSSGPLADLEQEAGAKLSQAGFPLERAIQGEQPHGNGVAYVTAPGQERVPGVDALVTSEKNLPLIVRVADCGPVYFYDAKARVIALAHSGRRGTEKNIVARTIEQMQTSCGVQPQDVIVQLGPCIRPPHYEIDFAEEIGNQALACGVLHYHDCRVCTACHLENFYSYRAEKGKTGRMWATLMLI